MSTRSARRSARTAPITTYYNGACPVCGTEVARYRRIARNDRGLAWCDITADPAALADRGVSADAVRRRLHVIDRGGRLLVGVPAFAALWEELPGYRWLAWAIRLPLVATIASWFYERLAAALFAWNRGRGR